ncbi:hypothetical protein HMPREF1018_04780, partial [Bacteroides fragilis]
RVSFFDNIFYWIWTTVPSKGGFLTVLL